MGSGRSCVPSTARGLAEEEANVKQPHGKQIYQTLCIFPDIVINSVDKGSQ